MGGIPSSDYGSWTQGRNVEVLVRPDEVQDLGGEFTDSNAVVLVASIDVSFAY